MTPHLQNMINNKAVYIYSHLPLKRGHVRGARGAFYPRVLRIWRCGYFRRDTKEIPRKGPVGRCRLVSPLLSAQSSCPGVTGWGNGFCPFSQQRPCEYRGGCCSISCGMDVGGNGMESPVPCKRRLPAGRGCMVVGLLGWRVIPAAQFSVSSRCPMTAGQGCGSEE